MHFKLIHADKASHKYKSCKKSFIRITDLTKDSVEDSVLSSEIFDEIEIEGYFCDLCTKDF